MSLQYPLLRKLNIASLKGEMLKKIIFFTTENLYQRLDSEQRDHTLITDATPVRINTYMTQSLSLSLSLSHTHIHTHTHTPLDISFER